ncbi:MAG: pentapeptide repeat-containing protein [Cyanobacteria bacterium P01_A01_bin.83]
MNFPDWTGFKGRKFWDWLELLLVPSMLGIGISFIEINEHKAQRYNLKEQYKQQILRDYLKEMTSIAFDKEKMNILRNAKKYSPEREVLASRTSATLEILAEDKKRKNQIIRFIGNSSLSRIIAIRRSKLNNLDLSYLDLTGADLRKTNLSNTNLKEANLKEANLCGTKFDNTNLESTNFTNAKYSEKTKFPNSISKLQIQSMKKHDSKSCDE